MKPADHRMDPLHADTPIDRIVHAAREEIARSSEPAPAVQLLIELVVQQRLRAEERVQRHADEVAGLLESLHKEQRENNVLRGLLSIVRDACVYCGLTDISRCSSGFPGCAQADDLLAGQDEGFRAIAAECNRLRAALRAATQSEPSSETPPKGENA